MGPRVVDEMLNRHGFDNAQGASKRRLVSIGSVMHLARDGDVIWGSGVNGKHMNDELPFSKVDIRAVRGPLTRNLLMKRGHSVPAVFGDPGLLVGALWPVLKNEEKRFKLTVVPNLNDISSYENTEGVLDPRSDLGECLTRIAQSEYVVGSSLHGIIVAESLGIPARLIASSIEPSFKYEDYYLGSGRSSYTAAKSVRQAMDLGGEPPVSWDAAPLCKNFPLDLWTQPSRSR